MSWNPFARQPKRSVLSKTEERDFERECSKINQLEEASKKVSKDAKKIVAAQSMRGKACGKIGQDLVAVLGESTPPSLKCFEYAMNSQAIISVDKGNIIQQVLADPMKKYTTLFPHFVTRLKTRDKALQERNKIQAKLEKFEDKEHTASNSVKVEQIKRTLEPVKEDFQQKHSTLMAEMPKFYDARLKYLQPSLEGVVSAQCWFHQQTIKVLTECKEEMGSVEEGNPDLTVKNILQEINALSITNDD